MNKTSNNISFLSGVFGGITVIGLLLIMLLFSRSFNYKSIYIVNPKYETNSLCLREIEILKNLEKEGLLTTPDQYANNIASYYNTFVAFLTIFFIFFSFVSYFAIKNISKKEIESNVEIALEDMLRDSIKFKETILKSIYGKLEENFVDKEDFSTTMVNLELKIKQIQEKLEINDNDEDTPDAEVE